MIGKYAVGVRAVGAGPIAASSGQTLTVPLIASGSSLYAPTVSTGAVSLSVPVIASTASLHSPTVSVGAVSVSPPLIASAATLHAPVVGNGFTLVAPLIPVSGSLYAPSISTGAVTVSPGLLDSTAVLYAPTVTQPGETTLTTDDLAAIDALIAARLADIAAAVLAAAQVTPIHTDVRKVFGTQIKGSGIPPTFAPDGTMTDPGDPWLPDI